MKLGLFPNPWQQYFMSALLHKDFIQHLVKKHSLQESILEPLIAPELLSPFEITLPKKILDQAQNYVRSTFQLRESEQYKASLSKECETLGLKDPGNKSILMSYDFHVDENMNLKLIEINTNASFLALGFEMYELRRKPLPVHDFKMEEILRDVETELKLQGKFLNNKTQIAIIDEEPEKQRLYSEFLVYQAYFKKWGYQCGIYDFRSLPEQVDFVYNRYTDFFLARPESQKLKNSFLSRRQCFSPNPYEYLVMADKQRMIDWSQEPWRQHIPQENLPFSVSLNADNSDQIWTERKKYFFKPKRAFGAKQSYKGASISRRLFEELIPQDFIAQEFCPAPELPFETPQGPQNFKYDLRFYSYQERVQMVVARLYQGQVTNLKTLYGGFAPVLFV